MLARFQTWAMRSPNRRIFAGALTIGMWSLVAKLLALAKELGIAAVFGRGDEIEAFLIAILLPQALGSMVGGSFQAAMVPAYVRTERDHGRPAADRLFSEFATLGMAALLGISALLALGGWWLLPFIAGGFAPGKLDHTLELFRLTLPVGLLGAMTTMLAVPLHAGERFAAVAAAPMCGPIAILIAVLGWGTCQGWSLAFGTMIGQVAEMTIILMVLIRHGHRARPCWPRLQGTTLSVIGQWWPALAASMLHGATGVVDQTMAAHLVPGSVAALGYAQRLILLPLGFVTAAIASSMLAVLSRIDHKGDASALRRAADWWRRRLLWTSTLGVVVMLVSAHGIVRLVFERGRFTSSDTAAIAPVVAAYSLMVPWYLVGIVGVRLLNIRGQNRRIMGIAGANLGISIAANLVMAPLFGATGIALASALVYFISFLQIEYALRKAAAI